jgi:hypothetical protein
MVVIATQRGSARRTVAIAAFVPTSIVFGTAASGDTAMQPASQKEVERGSH